MFDLRNLAIHSGWEYRLWQFEDVATLIPIFLGLQEFCPSVQHQADVARWLILLTYGGLYLDCDVEVFRLPEGLEGFWIQGTRGGGINNAVLASPPGHRHLREVVALASRAGAHRDAYCAFGGGCHLHRLALGPDVNVWPEDLWGWRARWTNGYGTHYGRFAEWRSLRPAER